MPAGSALQAVIWGWMIGDGEIAEPAPQGLLSSLALRLTSEPYSVERESVQVEGRTTWARYDAANNLLETVVEAPGFRILTQEPRSGADSLPQVGAAVSLTGYLSSVGDYEFVEFALPLVAQDWRVLAVRGVPDDDDVVVDLEPMEFRFNV